MLYVLPILFNTAKRVSAKSSQFQHTEVSLGRHTFIYIGLLAYPNFAKYVFNESSLDEGLQSEIIIAEEGEFVAIA